MTDTASASAALAGGDLAAAGAEGAASAGTSAAAASGEAANGNWFDSFDTDLKGYIQTKGWKDPAAVVGSYRNAEKLLGVPPEQVVKLPKDDAPAEAWDAVWKQLGAPETAEDYGFKPAEGGDPTMAEWMGKAFHEAKVPKGMAAKIAEKYQAFVQNFQEQQAATKQAKAGQEAATLKLEWGAAQEQNLRIAQKATMALGIDGEMIDKLEDAMGYAGVMKFFHGIGSKMGESDFVSGDTTNGFKGAMSPEQALAEINALKADKGFAKKYNEGDKEARARMSQLHKWAYPE